jgi:DNA-binding response OmpR family regulator
MNRSAPAEDMQTTARQAASEVGDRHNRAPGTSPMRATGRREPVSHFAPWGYFLGVEAARIVVAEEDAALRRLLADRLTSEGYEVRLVDSPGRLGQAAEDLDADLVVSSISERGPSVQWLRERSNVLFVAMLPCETAVMDALDVIDAGADDVLVKPFSPRELVTKMHALLRRSSPDGLTPRPLVFDGLAIDIAAREVTVRGEVVELPAREFDLLLFLASSPRQVFSRTQIMTHVWSVDDGLGTATVTEHVRRLRARIELDPATPRWIQTVWSVGYRFTP